MTAVADGPPVPEGSTGMDDLAGALRELRAWAGNPSYATLAQRVARLRRSRGVSRDEATPGRVTVYDCFRDGRQRLDMDLVLDIVTALGAGSDQMAQWRREMQSVLSPGGGLVPAQVSVDPTPVHLVGRDRELVQLRAAAARKPVLVTGMPAVGKTAVAVRAAHDLAEHLHARVLLVDLQGHTEDQTAVGVPALSTALLQQVRPDAPPMGWAEAVDAVRQELLRHRFVVVLDDVATSDQVAPILPADPACPIIMTSRHRLTDLPAVDEVLLEPLGPEAGLDLLESSSQRNVRDEEQARDLVRLAGGLPLALSLLGHRLSALPEWSLGDHLHAFRDLIERSSLDQQLEVALRLSYEMLTGREQRALGALSLHPTRTLGLDAARAVLDGSIPEVRLLLGRLVRANLLGVVDADRWELHDLVRVFAAARSVERDAPSQRRAARRRLIESYLARAVEAVAVLHPAAEADWYWQSEPARPCEPGAARDFLDEERANLMACVALAAEQDLPELACGSPWSSRPTCGIGARSTTRSSSTKWPGSRRCAPRTRRRWRSRNAIWGRPCCAAAASSGPAATWIVR